MEIYEKEVRLALLPLRRPLPGSRHSLLGHLLCPGKIYHFIALLPNFASVHPRHRGKLLYKYSVGGRLANDLLEQTLLPLGLNLDAAE